MKSETDIIDLDSIRLSTHPYLIFSSFMEFVIEETRDFTCYLLKKHRLISGFVMLLSVLLSISNQIQGPHRIILGSIQQQVFWYGTWFLLGVSSSIAVGAGFHTFILFLGPYIAEVTMAAYECHSAELLIRNPDSFRLIECANDNNNHAVLITVWTIFQKVKWESFIWGAGTAFGELPPYFIARAVAETGGERITLLDNHDTVSRKDKVLQYVFKMIQKLGFFGILLFASIPNPLFDLAGITCGHFKIPFTTFFGATFLGKACVKAAIQSLLVILVFSHDTLSLVLHFFKSTAPPILHQYIEHIINDQTSVFNKKNDNSNINHGLDQQSTMAGTIWNSLLSLMVLYYVLTSIESLGVAYIRKNEATTTTAASENNTHVNKKIS